MSKNDGGPAFKYEPLRNRVDINHGVKVEHIDNTKYSGATVRDYFTSEQTAAIIIGLMHRHKEPGYSDGAMIAEAVSLGNMAADAMMEERDK